MQIRELEYMGDAYIEVTGENISECFKGAAIGLLKLVYNIKKVELRERLAVEIRGYDLQNLLYKWLEFLIIKLTAEKFAAGEFDIRVDKKEPSLKGKILGEKYSPKKHGFRTEVKGITYHLMEINDEKKCKVRFLVDL
ncbi:MAG: archease [Nitrososphaeria archaeon]